MWEFPRNYIKLKFRLCDWNTRKRICYKKWAPSDQKLNFNQISTAGWWENPIFIHFQFCCCFRWHLLSFFRFFPHWAVHFTANQLSSCVLCWDKIEWMNFLEWKSGKRNSQKISFCFAFSANLVFYSNAVRWERPKRNNNTNNKIHIRIEDILECWIIFHVLLLFLLLLLCWILMLLLSLVMLQPIHSCA